MECREVGCTQSARFEGWCQYCVGNKWRPCKAPGCDQYTMDKSDMCFLHRGGSDLLSAGAAAELLHVHAKQVQRMADSGRLPCTKTDGGHRRFDRKDIREYLEARNAQGEETGRSVSDGAAQDE